MQKNTENQPGGEILLYQTEDGQTRLETRMAGEKGWLTQKKKAELFPKDVRTISEHIRNVYEEGELAAFFKVVVAPTAFTMPLPEVATPVVPGSA